MLGKANENLALIQNGSMHLAAMSPSYFPAEVPFHSAPNSIPMAMARVDQATALMERLLTEVPEFDDEAKRNGLKALFYHHLINLWCGLASGFALLAIMLMGAIDVIGSSLDLAGLTARPVPAAFEFMATMMVVIVFLVMSLGRRAGVTSGWRLFSIYKASGRIHVGTTQGRGRYDRKTQYDKPRKYIRLRSFRENWKRMLPAFKVAVFTSRGGLGPHLVADMLPHLHDEPNQLISLHFRTRLSNHGQGTTMKTLSKCLMTASTALLIMAVTAQASLAKVMLRANSQYAEVQVGSQVDKWWAEEISKRTNGEVEIKLFFSEALGKAKENLALLQEGAIDVAMMSAGYFPAELPFHAAPNSIPMAMANVDEAFELMTRLLVEVPLLEDEAKENGIKTLFFHHLNPYKLVCTGHITGIADMQGKKMRTWGKDLPRAVETVGATPVTLFFPDIYEALARNTVDCIPVAMDLFLNYKFYEVAKHVHDVTIWEGPTAGTWITLSAWDKLSAEQQKIVQEVSLEAMSRDRDMTVAAGEAAIAELKGHGVQFHDFPAADAAKWRELNPDFFGDFIKDMDAKGKGDAARKMIEIWKEVTGKM